MKYGGRIVIRHSPKIYDPVQPELGPTWSESNELANISADNDFIILPLIKGTYAARVEDSGGRASVGVDRVTTDLVVMPEISELANVQEHPVFLGERSNLTIYNDMLGLAGSGEIDDLGVVDPSQTIDDLDYIDLIGGHAQMGTYYFSSQVDLLTETNVTFSKAMNMFVAASALRMDDRTLTIDEWEDFSEGDPGTGDAILYYRLTSGDPAVTSNWSDWTILKDVPQVKARGVEFKLELTTTDPAFDTRVDELAVQVQAA